MTTVNSDTITIKNIIYYLSNLDDTLDKYLGKILYNKTTQQLCTLDYNYNKINGFEYDDEDYYVYIYMYERSTDSKEIVWTSKLMLVDNYNTLSILNPLLNNYQIIITLEQYNILTEIKLLKQKLDELHNQYYKLITNIIL